MIIDNPDLPDFIENALRLVAATAIGGLIGLNRDLRGKPTGLRTLGLVALGSALVTLSTTTYAGLAAHPDALSRVVQGVIQGIIAGVGFLGAGVILRDVRAGEVHGLTTAATVWVTAAIGIVCGLGQWALAATAATITLILLVLGGPLEALSARPRKTKGRAVQLEDDEAAQFSASKAARPDASQPNQ